MPKSLIQSGVRLALALLASVCLGAGSAFGAPSIGSIRVQSGDSLERIAKRAGLSVQQLKTHNALSSDTIQIGQVLRLPGSSSRVSATPKVKTAASRSASPRSTVVRAGDSLERIARRSGVSIRQLRAWNGLSGDTIRIGQALRLSATSSAGRTAAPLARKASPLRTSVVRPGDSLERIARRSGISVRQLRAWNGLSGDRIVVGQRLKIAPSGVVARTAKASRARVARTPATGSRTVTVQAGNSLERIARRAGVGVDQLRRWNGLSGDRIVVGQVLRLSPDPQRQLKYQKYLALKQRQRTILQVRYAQQLKYEKYLALKQRQRAILQARYARQLKYDRYLAGLERARLVRQQARLAQQRSSAQSRARATSRKVSFAGTANNVLSWPVRGFRLTSHYGERDMIVAGSTFHTGIDLAAPAGTPVYAAASGTVTQSGYGDYGLNVFVDHGALDTVYGHLSRTAVRPGESVQQGELLGYMGCTGICTGSHLHFEVRLNGKAQDPMGFMR